MKKITLLLILSFLAINANAQSEAKETVKTYIEIWSMHKSSTPTIDTGEGKGSETYKTEDGRAIEFHSSMGLLIGLLATDGNLNQNTWLHAMIGLLRCT